MIGIISFTIERILKIKNIILILSLVLLAVMGMSFGFQEMVGDLTKINLDNQMQMTVGLFGVVSFMWITGIPFLLIIIGFGSGLIMDEETDGTLLLLVSKPIKRYKIVLGKFIGLIISGFLLQVTCILGGAILFYNITGIDPDSLKLLIKILPGIIIYSLIVLLLFSTLSILLATILRKKVSAIIILLLLIMLTYGLTIILRDIIETIGLSYFDLNYQLSNIFNYLVFERAGIKTNPMLQMIMSLFIGVYENAATSFDVDFQALPPSLKIKDFVSPTISIMTCLIASATSLLAAIFIVNRRDVN